ncbi:GNAT family N-acetyltransferase [Fictibacillus phosphorivorans]|uniref:GNAT family N-acetyltransferase n=1 Tax=Fictibacillus phosphorivorans TaxID=1221500 RepID=UPI0012932FC7|nr:GNAT family N-acetyltransferase [Fictibacillus phosphorivorans]MQR94467.1 GNAT family N-acetyltransferase [Fictibacillus phosphorivorans]
MLKKQQLQDIKKLQKECEVHDDIQLKLNWNMLENRESDHLDFLYYENDTLIAFLGLYPFGSTVEVCGMVKPSERRKGHFYHLFQEGMVVAKQCQYKKILLNTPAASRAAKKLLFKIGANYSFSEHQMVWQRSLVEPIEGITLRQAEVDDLDMSIRISIEAFGMAREDATSMERSFQKERQTEMFMIDVDEKTVGKIRVSRKEREAWIYGFSILPEHQGQGIGRKVLCQVIKEQSSAGYSVHLEVETKNDQALGLYKAVGFNVVHSQDYYTYLL